MQVTLKRADASDIDVVKNFFVFFFHDLSQYDDNIIFNAHGLPMWKPSGLPGPASLAECADFNWWVRDEAEAYIIQADGQPAGYCLVLTEKKYLSKGVDFELLDFYIAPKYRRLGVGRQAARLAFDLHSGGTWQVFELERNTPARTFWQNIITDYTNGNYENLDGGTQQRFKSDK